jgi:hypothetical protein
VHWVNTFKIEVNGEDGYGIVEGRGKTYCNQKYITGKRWSWLESGKTQRESEKVILEDDCKYSFRDELYCLFNDRFEPLLFPCNTEGAIKTMQFYDRCQGVID